ncbi:MAG: aminopeptidase P N-terminal domain-containing protein [Ostreibacterium sp.]
MIKPITPMSVYKNRRETLMQQIGDAVLILPAAKILTRNRDCHYPFRQDSDFLYLTNFNEPDAILLLNGKTKQSILFSKPFDKLHAIWEGEIIGQDRAKSEYLFDEANELKSFQHQLLDYLYAHDTLITPFSRDEYFDRLLLSCIKKVKETRHVATKKHWLHSDQFIHPMRLIKDKYEIKTMQYAADISTAAHKAAMAETQPTMNEAEITAVFDYHFSKQGGTSAYGHIVAGGNNACTLHYTENQAELRNGDLLLIDAGAEIDGYAADITRTFPINGKFTDTQKQVYNWILKSMEAAFNACKSGNHIRSPHFAAEDVLIEGMIDLGLISGTVESAKLSKSYQRYFMHGTSHWLGIDVHDVGDYKDEQGEWLKLSPGMALTVEPGLYIRQDDMDAPEKLRGIGIRIEDDIIITEDGYLNLTDKAPKTIEAIEAVCQQQLN